MGTILPTDTVTTTFTDGTRWILLNASVDNGVRINYYMPEYVDKIQRALGYTHYAKKGMLFRKD